MPSSETWCLWLNGIGCATGSPMPYAGLIAMRHRYKPAASTAAAPSKSSLTTSPEVGRKICGIGGVCSASSGGPSAGCE
jgi:hypothetical protein